MGSKAGGVVFVLGGLFLLIMCCRQLLQSDVKAVPFAQRPAAERSPLGRKHGAYGPPATLSTIRNSAITESSGLAASRTSRGIYWTHNDSGDGPFLYALDTTGRSRGVWRVTDADATDWEDIAAGPGPISGKSYLYVGDIGDNNSSRPEIVVYRVLEPLVSNADRASTKERPRPTESADAIRLRYPDGKHDAEALMVHPTNGDLYVVTKVAFASPTVYKASAPLSTNKQTVMQKVADLRVPNLFGGIITGGDISPDGRRVALCDYFQGYELVWKQSVGPFDEIWNQRMTTIDLGKRHQGESVAYRLDGNALLMTSEGRSSELIQVVWH
jgi:hypothetical protein